MSKKFDVAVIGGGPGGYVAAIRASQFGFQTVCIDKEKNFGGTCLNVGCIPSKALLQSTEYYAFCKHEAEGHGISFQNLQIDFSRLMQKKEKIVQGLADDVSQLLKQSHVEQINGKACFISPNQIEVTTEKGIEKIEAAHFILATGSEPISLLQLPFDEKVIVSSTGALALSSVPKRMVVIGAGVIGVELASVYHRLGSEVIIVEMLDHICPSIDRAMGKILFQSLKKQGMTFHLSTQVTKGKIVDQQVSVAINQGEQGSLLTADVVLVAIGRRPYTRDLGLNEIGVKVGPKGDVLVDHTFRTSLSHIYAIGDLIAGPMLAHRASAEGIAVAETIAGQPSKVCEIAIPQVIYTFPEVASVGISENEAREYGLSFHVGIAAFKGNPRARCMSETEGVIKVIGDTTTQRLLGMHIVGPHASELIAEGVLAMEKQATLHDLAYAPHAHPTLSEAVKEAAWHALRSE